MKTISDKEFRAKYGDAEINQFMNAPQQKGAYGKFADATENYLVGDAPAAFQSGVETSKRGYEQASNAKNVGDLFGGSLNFLGGAIGAAFSPLSGITKPISQAVNYTSDIIGNIPAVQKFATSPAGEATSAGVEAANNLNTVFGMVAGLSGGPKVRSELTKPKPTTIPKELPPPTEPPAMIPNRNFFESATQKMPSKIMQRVARVSKGKQANFERMAGESVGDYLSSRGIFGNVDEISTQLYDRFTKSKGVADSALEKLPGTYEPAPVKTMLNDLLEREVRVSTPGAPSPNLARIQQLNLKSGRQGWNMSEINEIKRMYERTNKMDYLRQNAPESVAKANNLDSAVRNWQFKQARTLGLKNLDKINKETQLAKQLLDDLGQEYSGSAGNNMVTLSDWVALTGGEPNTAISTFLVKKTFSSKKVQSALAKWLNMGEEVKPPVGADMGPSQVPQLTAPKPGTPQSQNFTPPRMPTRGVPNEAPAKQIFNQSKMDYQKQLPGPSGKPLGYQNPDAIKQPSRKAIQSGTEIVPRSSKPQSQLAPKKVSSKSSSNTSTQTTAKAIPEATKDEMVQAIDYLRLKKPINNIMEDTLDRLTQKYGINPDQSSLKIADQLQDLIEKTKTTRI